MPQPNENMTDAVQAAYAESFPQIKRAVEELHALNDHPAIKAHAGKMAANMQIDWKNLAGQLSGEFCRDWPILKKAVGFIQGLQGIPFLSWIMPQVAAALSLVAPIIAMVDKIYPQICPAP